MKDRFRFRCFNRKTKKMYNVDSLHLDSENEWVWVHYYNPIYDKDLKIQIEKPKAIIMQCTGLKDKNGKLIYEGDIVKFNFDTDEIIAVVSWDDNEGQIGYYLNTTDYFKDKYVTDYDFYKNDYEVLGNIYENKELLQERTVQN